MSSGSMTTASPRPSAASAANARLDTVLRFIVEFQHSYSLRRLVDVEPEYVVREMTRVLPIMRDRLLPHFPGPGGLHRRHGRGHGWR